MSGIKAAPCSSLPSSDNSPSFCFHRALLLQLLQLCQGVLVKPSPLTSQTSGALKSSSVLLGQEGGQGVIRDEP